MRVDFCGGSSVDNCRLFVAHNKQAHDVVALRERVFVVLNFAWCLKVWDSEKYSDVPAGKCLHTVCAYRTQACMTGQDR